MKYVVEIIPESITDLEAATSSLAKTLKLDPAKAAALLRRNPVTKPVSEAEAEKVARLFTRAGIEVFIRSEEEAPVVTPQPASQPSQTAPQTEIPQVSEAAQPIFDNPSTPVDTMTNAVTSQIDNGFPSIPPETEYTPDLETASYTEPAATDQDSFEQEYSDEQEYSEPLAHTPASHDPSPQDPILQDPILQDPMLQDNAFHVQTMHGEETLKIPSGFFTPVPESDEAPAQSQDLPAEPDVTLPPPVSARGGLGKIAFASIVPGLLALAGVFTALYMFGLPFLRTQHRTAAETTAVSLASSIGSWLGDVSLSNPTLGQQVQSVVANSQAGLRGRGIDFVLLADSEGNQLAGWFKDLPTPGVPDTVTATPEISSQISSALGGTTPETSGANSQLIVDGETLELASAAVRQGETPVGAVVVGSSQQPLMTKVRELLNPTVLAGVLPLLLGILLSLLIGRSRS